MDLKEIYNNETVRPFLVVGAVLVFFVALISVTQIATDDTELAHIPAETQGASLNWAANNTSLSQYSGYPAPEKCAENGNLGNANRYICMQERPGALYGFDNVFGAFSVNERDYADNGAVRYFKAYHSNTGTDLGLRVLWSQPDRVMVDGVNRVGTQYGDEAFVKATFNDSGGYSGWSLGGEIYTAGDISIANDNMDEVHEGLLNLAIRQDSIKGTGITVAAGVPVRLEWSCQNYQIQVFDAQCGNGQYDCTTGRKIDGFRDSLTSSDNPNALFNGVADGFSSVTDRSSAAPQDFVTYQPTELSLRCMGEQNTGGESNIFMYIGVTGALRDITWRTPARNGPWMDLTINTVHAVGTTSLTAYPDTVTVGENTQLEWHAVDAHSCRVIDMRDNSYLISGTNGWQIGTNCHNIASSTVSTQPFAAAGTYTFQLEYVTYNTSGVPTSGFRTATVTVNAPIDICTNISGNQTAWPVPAGTGSIAGTVCSCNSPDYEISGTGSGAFCDDVSGPGPQPPPTVSSFNASPLRVRAGTPANLLWNISDFAVGECNITSNPAGFNYAVTAATHPGLSTAPFNVMQTTIFTLSCGASSQQSTVRVIPSFEEI